ncbi:MAG: CDP-diacylglycerol O-phosphatidyltransferase [Acidobacteria bacterium]|nr:CDP-diacylglycerol O-phosphatidyltransferase [Acidobacteriota bacterium]
MRQVNEATGKFSALPWLVHAYTASGAVLAFAAVLATFQDRYRDAFLLLVAATCVDATDGVLARWARVKERTPGFDGARLDDIVDYLTFVFVPLLILLRAGHLPSGWGFGVASAVLLSSAYGFASLDAKTDDHYFTGFPSYWNIVALYLHAARTPPLFNAWLLLVLVALVFVRIGYVYPSRTPVLRRTTVLLGGIWAIMMLVVLYMLPDVPRTLLIISLFFPVYYTMLSFWLHFRRRP